MKILLIAGGWSNEREVSLSGAKKIEEAIKELGHAVTFFDPAKEFKNILTVAKQHDFAFLNLHGQPGEDGLIQLMLDKAGCPYQGTGPAGSYLALNKAASKVMFERENIPTPEWELVTAATDLPGLADFAFPAYLKRNTGGSSIGAFRVESFEEFKEKSKVSLECEIDMLLEREIRGVELTCSVLDQTPLPLILIRPQSGSFFDYDSKYLPGGAEEICPAPVSDEITALCKKLALKAHNALGLKGVSRADFIMDENEVFLLEVNTLPGMTPTSLLPRAAKAQGYDFPQLIDELIKISMR